MIETPTSGSPVPPALADGVRLHGEMRDVGFTTTQWLIERDGQFLQTSELLYRVVQEIDGVRSTAEIAARVSASSTWTLEPEHVEYLIEKKLRPLRIVVDPGGVAPAAERRDALEQSPLRLNMRMRMLPPAFVERCTQLLQYAYAPAVLIPLLAVIAGAHWWLYVRDGAVTRGVERALYEPGAMGAVLLLTVIAGLFHELGHSAALRYGGGRPRGIGFGFYLMFPAFYSDVTDSYRLGRAARIRTDLGGIYFHLVFAAGMIGLAAWTRNEFVLAAALLFNLEAVRQLIPFIRLDGYWLLADLTGVPDFLSQVRVFVHSLPWRSKASAGVPRYKPWVAVVFGLYLLLSVPATLYVLGLMVIFLPALWEITGHALFIQTQLWTAADTLTRVLIGAQIALLPVPVLATCYFLYVTVAAIGAQLGAHLGWAGTTVPVRRFAGATALAATVAFAAMSWPGAASGPASAFGSPLDERPDPGKILRQAQESISRLTSLEADLRGSLDQEEVTGSIALTRPNRAHVQVRGAKDSLGTFDVVSDGRRLLVLFPADKKYTETQPGADGRNINAFMVDHVRTFFRPERLSQKSNQLLAYAGQEHFDGSVYDVVEVRVTRNDGITWRYYISPHDRLIHRVVMTRTRGGKESTRSIALSNIRINRAIDESRFNVTLPEGAEPLSLDGLGVPSLGGAPRN